MSFSEKKVYTVAQFNRQIKQLLETDFRFVWISGEISNLRIPYSGHSYFVLKDKDSQLRAVLFKQQRRFVNIDIKDGQQVICFGRITVYEPRGEYQLIVDSIELQGKGDLYLRFEALKRELTQLAYFAHERKKAIPRFPKKICVITSPTGAAIRDFLKILKIRDYPATVQIIPVRVQGEGAAEEIAMALAEAEESHNYDIIVLCRGGGSIEDLWAFNERVVADAIFHCQVPVVTGVGHEIDLTIADLCADLRCATPTAVAERIFPAREQLQSAIDDYRDRMIHVVGMILNSSEQRVDYALRLLGDFSSILAPHAHRLQVARFALAGAVSASLRACETRLSQLTPRITKQAPLARIEQQDGKLQLFVSRLTAAVASKIANSERDLARFAALLDGVSPLATLARGYSITRKLDDRGRASQPVVDSCEVEIGEQLEVTLHKGRLRCVVNRKTS